MAKCVQYCVCVCSTETWVQPTESNAPSLRCLWWVSVNSFDVWFFFFSVLFFADVALCCVSGWKQVFRNDVEENEGWRLWRYRWFHQHGIPGRSEPFAVVCLVFHSRGFIGPPYCFFPVVCVEIRTCNSSSKVSMGHNVNFYGITALTSVF